jgi:hypothetical protein
MKAQKGHTKQGHTEGSFYEDGYSQTRIRQLFLLASPLAYKQIAKRLNINYRSILKARSKFIKDGFLTQNRALTMKGKEALKSALVVSDEVHMFGDKNLDVAISKIIRAKTIRFYCEVKFKIQRDYDPKLKPEKAGSFAVFRTWEIKNVRFKETIIDEVRVRRTSRSVIFIPPYV